MDIRLYTEQTSEYQRFQCSVPAAIALSNEKSLPVQTPPESRVRIRFQVHM